MRTWRIAGGPAGLRAFCAAMVLTVGIGTTRAATSISILPLGDSITDGNTGNTTDDGGYRTQMVTNLVKAGYATHVLGSNVLDAKSAQTPAVLINNDALHHEGHGGYTIAQITANLDGNGGNSGNNGGYWLTGGNGTGRAAITPNYTLLMAGTNDIINDYGAHSTAGTPMNGAALLSQMQADMTTLVNKITTLRPTTKLMVASIIAFPNPFVDPKITGYPDPTGTEADQTDYALNHYVIPYNAWLKNTLVPTLQAAGKNVQFVDEYADFIGTNAKGQKIILPNYGDYGLHPNTTGYNAIGATFANAIMGVPEPGVLTIVAGSVGLLVRRRRSLV